MKEFINIEHTIKTLNSQDIVAVPTETVYGLAAKVDSEKAIKKIFETKDRPLFDPLIVHVCDLKMIYRYVLNPDPILLKLALKFWPGPLTLIFNKNPKTISDLITAGSDTVALRCPNHPMTLELIKKLDEGIAAPSANPFKKTSPTEALHVREYFPQLEILDGGACEVGIESTIVKLNNKTLEILRPGQITKSDLMNFCRDEKLELQVIENFNSEGPGSMQEHYQPKALLYIFKTQAFNPNHDDFKNKKIKILKLNSNPKICARLLYKDLIEGSNDADVLVLAWTFGFEDPNWTAIYNRLEKAAKVIY
jgi:L-threonylcarbamoyladenylate synthase